MLLGKQDVGKNVVIIGGGLVGAETAEYLSANGIHVSLIEMLDQIAKDGEAATNQFLIGNLKKYDVDIYTSTSTDEIEENRVKITTPDGSVILNDIDDVIIATGFRSNTELDNLLLYYKGKTVKVGDANTVKNGLHNLREAYELAIKL